MELNNDWKNFQSMFYPNQRSLLKPNTQTDAQPDGTGRGAKALGILEGENLVCGFCDGRDFTDFVGATREDLEREFSELQWIFFDRGMIDSWMAGSLGMASFLEQVEYFRGNARDAVLLGAGKHKRQQLEPVFFKRHFFLEALQGWWAKVLPSAYGVFIRLEAQKNEDLLLVIKAGEVVTYTVPDLTALGEERGRDREQIIRYLAEKNMVPVQGVFLSRDEWKQWGLSKTPWKIVAQSIRAERVRFVPFRWGVVGLIAAKGVVG